MDKLKKIIKSLNSRSLKYGSLSVILVVAVAAILILLNVMITTMQDKGIIKTKFDLTSNKQFSIGSTTKDILKQLNKDVDVYGLFDIGQMNSDSQLKQIKETLSQYEQYSHIKIHYEDPDKNPGLIKTLDPTGTKGIQKQDFVIKSGNKLKVLSYSNIFQDITDQSTGQSTGQYSFIGEQSFTGAIKYVSAEKTPAIYFTQGHNEGTIENNYASLKSFLETNNYDVKSINLTTESKVPEDTEILIIASPKSDLTATERDKITEYLKNGGNAVFLFDSLETDVSLKGFETILANYNVGLNYDKVKENSSGSFYPGNNYAVAPAMSSNAIIPSDIQLAQLLLVNSRSLKVLKNAKDYITVTPLLSTTDQAVGEQINKSKDSIGPLDLAFGVENQGFAKPSKILVFGNAAFLSDDTANSQYAEYLANAKNFFAIALNWVMNKQDDILIEAKDPDNAQITLKSDAQLKTLGFAVIILLPLLIFGAGTFVWMRRRHL
jgi:ABC-2 type transport system permease protein